MLGRRTLVGLLGALVLLSATASIATAQTGEPTVPPAYLTPDPAAAATSPSSGQPSVVVVPAYAPPMTPIAPAPMQGRMVEVERSTSIRALWLPGLIALPIAWISTWTAASSYLDGDALTYSWIPVIGPWLMLTQDLNGGEAGFIISGVIQGVAALMIVLGVSLRRSWTETQYVVEPAPGVRARVTFDAIALPGGGVVGAQLTL